MPLRRKRDSLLVTLRVHLLGVYLAAIPYDDAAAARRTHRCRLSGTQSRAPRAHNPERCRALYCSQPQMFRKMVHRPVRNLRIREHWCTSTHLTAQATARRCTSRCTQVASFPCTLANAIPSDLYNTAHRWKSDTEALPCSTFGLPNSVAHALAFHRRSVNPAFPCELPRRLLISFTTA